MFFKISPEINSFLIRFDQITDSEISTFISQNREIYQQCIKLLIADKEQANAHPLALQKIAAHIIKEQSFDDSCKQILKIANESGLIKSSDVLYQAVKNDQVEHVRALLESGYDINARNFKDKPPFYCLIVNPREMTAEKQKLIEIFLNDRQFDPTVKNFEGFSLLHKAFSQCNSDIAIGLVKKGASLDSASDDFKFPQEFWPDYSHENRDTLCNFIKDRLFETPELKEEDEIKEKLWRTWRDLKHHFGYTPAVDKRDICDFLEKNPSFGKKWPNFTTFLIGMAFTTFLPLERIQALIETHSSILNGQQRCKELMRQAIESGQLLIVRELAKRINLHEPYHTPLIDASKLADKTPLHHALFCDQLDIAAFLLECGVPIDIQDRQGQTPMQAIMREKGPFASNSLTFSWMIDHGAEIESTDSEGETLFELVAKDWSVPWFLIFQLLEKGARLSKESRLSLLDKAFWHGQISVINLLIEQAEMSRDGLSMDELLQAIRADRLAEINNVPWVQSILSRLAEKGMPLTSLYPKAIDQKNYSLAAFLISKGVNPDGVTVPMTPSLMEGIKINAQNMQKGSEVEQHLRQELSARNLGHLLGDSFLKKMKDAQGQNLEGNQFSVSISFMSRLLDDLLEKSSEELSEKTLKEMRLLNGTLKRTLKLAWRIEDARRLAARSSYEVKTAIYQLGKTLKDELEQLKSGEFFLIPFGWYGIPLGHATLLDCRKVKGGFILNLINTGGGLEFHQCRHDANKLYGDTVQSFFVPDAVIRDDPWLQQIIEPNVLGVNIDDSRDCIYRAQDLYAILKPFEMSDDQKKEFAEVLSPTWMESQLSGTCSFRCLLALMASRVGLEDYKILNRLMKEEVTQLGFDQHRGFILSDPALIKLFSEAAPRLFGHIIKSIRGLSEKNCTESLLSHKLKKVEQLQGLHEAILQALPSQRSQSFSISDGKEGRSKTQAMRIDLQRDLKVNGKIHEFVIPIESNSLPIIQKEDIKNGKQLLAVLENYSQYLAKVKFEQHAVPCVGHFLIELGRLFLSEERLGKASIVADLKDQPDQCLKILDLLGGIATDYFDSTGGFEHFDGSRSIVLYSALSVAWIIACLIDEHKKYPPEMTLSRYGLHCEDFIHKFHSLTNTLVSPKLEQDFARIKQFLLEVNQQLNSCHLFAFKVLPSLKTLMTLDPSEGDLKYVEAFLKDFNNAEELEKADKEYQLQLKNFPGLENIPLNRWRAYWCFVRKLLPAHYYSILKLALMAQVESPFTNTKGRSITQMELTGPFLHHSPSNNLVPIYQITNKRIADFIKDPLLREIQEFLPKDNAQVKDKPSTFDRIPYTFAFLTPENQNKILATTAPRLHELISLRIPKNALVAMTMLLDYFENLRELTQQEGRILFACTLNHPEKIVSALKKKPVLAFEWMAFFDKTIDHFQTQLLANEDRKKSLQAILFLLEHKQRTLRHIYESKVPFPSIETLEKARGEIRQWRDSLDCADLMDQQYLSLILLDSYNIDEKLTDSQIKELVRVRAELERQVHLAEKKPLLFPALWNTAQLATISHQQAIQQYLQNVEERNVLGQILTHYNGEGREAKWKEHGFPIYLSNYGNQNYQLNVLTGQVLKNSHPFLIISHLRTHPLYKELFGDRILMVNEQGDCYESQDEWGSLRLYFNKKMTGDLVIHRQIEGHWYQYIPQKDFDALPPLPELENLQLWQSIDREKTDVRFLDKQSMLPKYILDSEGYFHFPVGPHSKRYEWVEHPLKGHFDPKAILWKPAPESSESYPALLVMPHYRDEHGNLMEFIQKEGHWIWKTFPHLRIAEDQSFQGITNLSRFLVLENGDREKEILIPRQTFTELNTQDSYPSTCERIKLENGKPTTRSPSKNAYLAYLALAHANTQEEQATAMEYLKNAFRYERYTPEDLRIFGWIFNLKQEKTDYSGSREAVRLYAAWLVSDNLRRNPTTDKLYDSKNRSGPPLKNAPAEDWELYWNNQWEWRKKNGEPGYLNAQLTSLTQRYLARRTKVQPALRLENILHPQALMDWGFMERAIPATDIMPPKPLPQGIVPFINLDEVWLVLKDINNTHFQTRPKNGLKLLFYRLYAMANSADIVDQRRMKELIHGMAYDPFPNNAGFHAILQAAMMTHGDKNQPGYEQAKNLIDYVEDGFRQGWIADDAKKKLNSLMVSFFTAIRLPKTTSPQSLPTISQPDSIELPSAPPMHEKMVFKPLKGKLDELNVLFDQYFCPKPGLANSTDIESFSFYSEDTFIQKGIALLNRDYQKGAEKNQAMPIYALREGLDLKSSATAIMTKLKDINERETADLKKLKEDMLQLVNTPPEDLKEKVLEKAAIFAKQKIPLNENDCKALFLHGDPHEFRRLTHLKSDEDIQTLYQTIGDYLCLSRKADHVKALCQSVKALELISLETGKEAEKDAFVQKIGEGLNVVHYVIPEKDPQAFLVLEEGLKLFLKQDQVEGLLDMLPPAPTMNLKCRLLQRIQGGGKSLIFGHVLALLKADGYHLSVHVPPTSQYGTALYDMRHISGKVLGQKEQTLVFDDNPERFTVKYLKWMKHTMTQAVIDREYITMTIETLRAMRCKYLKMRFIQSLMMKVQGKETPEIKELETKNSLLKDMMKLLRKRGVFTFDEVHLAYDPDKELNMPFGECGHIALSEAKLIARLIQLACLAKDDKDFLLKLRQNQQSQQTDSDYQKMLQSVVKSWLGDVSLKQHLKQFVVAPEEKHLELYDFFIGKSEDIPDFISQRVDPSKPVIKETADLIVLAKQMLGGQWLKDRLNKSVEEHHGFSSLQPGPRIAIPFTANTKPSEGSEFSDRYVMITNTLMTYAVQGLSPKQLTEWIGVQRKQAYNECLIKKETHPQFALKDTTAAVKFQKVCNLNLFQIDTENKSIAESVQQSLLSGTEEAMEMLFQFVIEQVLPHVEIYDQQVNTHGQNTASMACSFLGYSASLDNLHMAPPGTIVQPELGTNGQTIDLLVRQNDDSWMIRPSSPKDEIDPIFTDLISQHPEKSLIRAIIDVGCHFRGIQNEQVAKRICQYLQTSPIEGVLYFSSTDGKLMFMDKKQPEHPTPLSGTRPETIQMETGYPPEQLFTYYDQDHITGMDIAQAKDTKAVLTWSEHTQIHDALQGGRRLRELHLRQRLISACEQGAVNKMGVKLNQPTMAHLPIGKVNPALLNIRHLILYAHLKQSEAQREKNLLFCLQKIENTLQQHILDKAFDLPAPEELELLERTSHLFVKHIAIDLYREYAFKRKEMGIKGYLESMQLNLISSIKTVLSEKEYKALNDQMTSIIQETVEDLTPFIKVSPNSQDVLSVNRNPEASMVQFRQQVEKKNALSENQQEIQMDQNTLTIEECNVLKNHTAAAELPFAGVLKPAFAHDIQLYTGVTPKTKAEIWNLNQVLSPVLEKYGDLFDPNLLVTSNFACVMEKRLDLLGPFRKTPFQWLLICDEKEGKKCWKLLLLSIKDAEFFMDLNEELLPKGRSMYLLRATTDLKILQSYGEKFTAQEIQEDPQVKKLIAQALLFSGKLRSLNHKKWATTLDEVLPQGKARTSYRKFFEEQVLRSLPSDYLGSPVFTILNNDVAKEHSMHEKS